jgi:ergothioneine biosynthesis protein EgtB
MRQQLLNEYISVRKRSEALCSPLETEDYVVQPIIDVSPPKWHLGHTTWFFETFILKALSAGYKEFDSQYNFVFNSYYETIGARVIRTDRGNLSRPSVDDVYRYRKHVDKAMISLLSSDDQNDLPADLIALGLNHEQQHQELLLTDIKYILGHNPLFPAYNAAHIESVKEQKPQDLFHHVEEGIYEIGFKGEGFSFDNESSRHKVWLDGFDISTTLVTNGEYLEFINAGGYTKFQYWHAEGWDWVKQNQVNSPLYWHWVDGIWMNYCLAGLTVLDPEQPLTHISFFEAAAFAAWKGMRLPTESEWEVASGHFQWGQRWEWTNSAYLPYPGFKTAPGALGEYNGKFMINQMVLRGASVATSEGHSRHTYRNFFPPHLRWQYTGIRLVQ